MFSCLIQHWRQPLQSWLEIWKALTIINRNGYCLNDGLATTLQSTSHKIMQITFFFRWCSIFSSPLLLYCHNCSVLRKLSCMFSTALFFSGEPQQSGREKKNQAMLVVWDYADSITLNVLNESLMLPTVTFLFSSGTSITIFSSLCRTHPAVKVTLSFRWGHSGCKKKRKRKSVIRRWICPRFLAVIFSY